MVKRPKAKIMFFSCSFLVILLMAAFLVCLFRGWKRDVQIESRIFTESARELPNPNRGFYRLYIFSITDEKQDYPQMISTLYQQDTDTRLTLIQICLQSYREGAISKEGLANIEALFDALKVLDKQLIVRFTYDSEGLNEKYEPETLDIILRHMEQLSPVLRRYGGKIFTTQGLFIGNWGEMNGTRYDSEEDLRRLAEKLAGVTDDTTYLAVRLPAQWRSILQWQPSGFKEWPEDALAGRMGLFNDGMLGNESDYGTYSTGTYAAEQAAFPRLGREAELEFQNRLCQQVPNGGEVIHENRYNDLDRAIGDLERMHVTYLNRAYDQEVLEKWADTEVTEAGCFRGMDGLTYIERRLGYRLAIVSTALCYQSREDMLTVEVTLKNAGFAPLYKETKVRMILYEETKDEALVYPLDSDLRALAGGNEKGETMTLSLEIPFGELSGKAYMVYFSIVDAGTGETILLANEEDAEKYGYRIGSFRQQWRLG